MGPYSAGDGLEVIDSVCAPALRGQAAIGGVEDGAKRSGGSGVERSTRRENRGRDNLLRLWALKVLCGSWSCRRA